ncbi:chloride channel protein [Dongia sp.]|uniref:chloride channel protein n=1 Tax=Dongia sp. TaxID=1977262 RepID=UPI0035AF7AB1
MAADLMQHIFAAVRTESGVAAFLLTIIGFPLLAMATYRWSPAAKGSGIPQVIAARRHTDVATRLKLIGLKTTAWKVLATILGLGVGAAVGREGPTVQVGASIMYVLGLGAGLRRPQGLVLAGAAAGIAAAFNTPLAGIMFAIEEMAKSYEKRISGLLIAAVVIAGAVSISLLGNYRYFGESVVTAGFVTALVWSVICGLVCGLAGAIFSFSVVQLGRLTTRATHQWPNRRRWIFRIAFPALCGLVVAVAGLMTDGYANGTGYEETRTALTLGSTMPWFHGLWKLLATLASSVSGIPGGLFAPSLSVGAGLGAGLAQLMGAVDVRAVMLLGMAAYFAAVVQSPLTAFVIVTEMSVSNQLLVPLLSATFIATGVSRLIMREPLYHALSRQY